MPGISQRPEFEEPGWRVDGDMAPVLASAGPECARIAHPGFRMTRRAVALAALLVVTTSAGLATPPDRQANPQNQARFVVIGRLIDAVTGEPIASAVVAMTTGAATGPGMAGQRGTSAAPVERVFTDPDGRFMFHSLPAGSYSLTAVQVGFFSTSFGQVRFGGPSRRLELGSPSRNASATQSPSQNASATQEVTNITLRMWKEGQIAGRIHDETGEPMPNVPIAAAYVTGPAEFRQYAIRWRTTTDDRGVYQLGSLPPGDVVIVAGWQAVTSVPQEAAIAYLDEMALRAGNTVREAVVASGGTLTTAGQRVGDQLIQLPTTLTGNTPVTVDVAGRISVYPSSFFPGVPTIEAARVITLAPGVRVESIDMTLRPVTAHRVSGRVTGGPASYVTVQIAPMGAESRLSYASSGGEIAQAITRADGSFTAIGVPAGRYTVSVTRPAASPGVDGPPVTDLRLWWASATLVVGNADVKDVNLQLTPGVTVSGRIEFEPGAAEPPAAALERARVLLRPVVPRQELRGSAPVSKAGAFTSAEVPPGLYTLSVSLTAPGWTVKSIVFGGTDVTGEPLDVPASGLTNVVVTYTDAAGELGGTVSGASGASGATVDARVYLLPVDSRSSPLGRSLLLRSIATADGDGYRFTSVVPGEYIVAAVPGEAPVIEPGDKTRIAALVRSGTRVTVGPRAKVAQALRIVEVK